MKVGDYEYKFLSKMGKGGMGQIYFSQNVRTGQLVAIKEFLPETYHLLQFPTDPEYLIKCKVVNITQKIIQ